MVKDFFEGLFMVLAGLFCLVIFSLAYIGLAYCMSGESEYVKSTEFVTDQAGASRFQRYETNDDEVEVIVDAETGVAYLVTSHGVTQLVERDGEPLAIAEVGE